MSYLIKTFGVLTLLLIIAFDNHATGLQFCGRDIPKMIIESCGALKKRSTETQLLGDPKNLAKRFYINGLLQELWYKGKLLDYTGRPLNAVVKVKSFGPFAKWTNKQQRNWGDRKARLELLNDMVPGLKYTIQHSPDMDPENQRGVLTEPSKGRYDKFYDNFPSFLRQLGQRFSGSHSAEPIAAENANTAEAVKKAFPPMMSDGRPPYYFQKRDDLTFVSLVNQCCRKGCSVEELNGFCDV